MEVGVARDSEQSLYVDIHLSGALSAVFGRGGKRRRSNVQAMWTGNMGFSSDGFPWVGMLPASVTQREVDGSDSKEAGAEWISAVFWGEGMVHAWLCGEALGTMILARDGQLDSSKSDDLSWFPEELLVSEKRIRASMLPHVVNDSAKRTSTL